MPYYPGGVDDRRDPSVCEHPCRLLVVGPVLSLVFSIAFATGYVLRSTLMADATGYALPQAMDPPHFLSYTINSAPKPIVNLGLRGPGGDSGFGDRTSSKLLMIK